MPSEPDPTGPRIEPIDRSVATEEQAELLEALGPAGDMNLFRTLAHNPRLMRSWLRFAGKLLQRSSLPERDRELVILRSSTLCDSHYEWGQHVGLARGAGLGDDEIRRVAAGADAAGWSEWDEALLRGVDELVLSHCLSDASWGALSARYDTAQLVELTMLAGAYAMLAGVLRSAGTETEGPLPRVGEV